MAHPVWFTMFRNPTCEEDLRDRMPMPAGRSTNHRNSQYSRRTDTKTWIKAANLSESSRCKSDSDWNFPSRRQKCRWLVTTTPC